MSMSKEQASRFTVAPFVFELVGNYLQQLFLKPVRTQAVTNSLVLFLGNVTSQCLLSERKPFDKDSAMATALFGLVFGGAIPHNFYKLLDSAVRGKKLQGKFFRFLIERLLFTPAYLLLRLYMTAIFEGKSHQAACRHVHQSYQILLRDNWYSLSLFQFYCVNFIPSMFRPLFSSVIDFFWTVHFTNKRREIEERKR
ncbi:peroxisomal membrane protein 2 [Neocloeon triangulifer]|uniref:peroxisomal membrane protein 2 n=1 Tax=Neocloeon triangulifer TaxID=2078957 RepID=UPI00286EB822|nr:peroxisomal membrane protein 2 [Neocloeon triangulifer]